MEKLSIFTESAKIKNYDAAYKPWMLVRKQCPKLNNAIYVYGEKILTHKIGSSSDEEKISYLKDMLQLWKEKREFFPEKTPLGAILAKSAQFKYDNMQLLKLSDSDVYESFENAYDSDLESFNNPKNLYTYFQLAVKLYDKNEKTASELFTKYDEISEKVENEIKNYTNKVNKFIDSADQEITLSVKDQRRMKSYNSFLKAYLQISKGMEKALIFG
jgi:predicted solute-binding protein